MKSLIQFLLSCLFTTAAIAQNYVPVDAGSSVEFTVIGGKNYNKAQIKGRLSKLGGRITFDKAHPEKAQFDVTLSTLNIQLSSPSASQIVAEKSYLNTTTYPTVRIKSLKVTHDGGPVYELIGNVTLKGITKPVKIQFTVQPLSGGLTFRGLLQLNRQQFGIGSPGEMDDIISVYLNIKTKKV